MNSPLNILLGYLRCKIDLVTVAEEENNFPEMMDDIIEIIAAMVSIPENPVIIKNLSTKLLLEGIENQEFWSFMAIHVVFEIDYDIIEFESTFCRNCNHRYDGVFSNCYNCSSTNIVVQTAWKCQVCGEIWDDEQQAINCNEEHSR